MSDMKAFLLTLIALGTLTASLCAQTRLPHHPLDALTTDEYWTVHDVLEQSGRFTDKTLVASLLLHEGRSVIYVARQLGHDARLTLTRYGHVIDAYAAWVEKHNE